jgi:hypothetical protein
MAWLLSLTPLHLGHGVAVVGFQTLGGEQRGLHSGRLQSGRERIGDCRIDLATADVETVLAASFNNVLARTMVARADISTSIMDAQSTATVATDGKALQQRGTLSHRSAGLPTSRHARRIFALVRLGTGIGIDTHSVGLEGIPVDKAPMVVADQNRLLIAGQSA